MSDIQRPKCLVALSGGVESSTLLYEMHREYNGAVAAWTMRNKPHGAKAAIAVARSLGVPHVVADPKRLLRARLVMLKGERFDHLPELYTQELLPHICMIAESVAFATMFGIRQVVWGWRRSDFSEKEGPEQHPSFLRYLSTLNQLYGGPAVAAPFFDQTKVAVIRRGLELGVPFKLTRSCSEDKPKPCGECRRCRERAAAFAALKRIDR